MLRYIYLREQQLSSWCFSDQRMIENVWCWFRLRIYTPLHSPLPAPASSYSEACRFLAPAPPRTSPGPTPSKWVSQNAKVQSCWSLTIHHSPPQSLLPRPLLRASARARSDPFWLLSSSMHWSKYQSWQQLDELSQRSVVTDPYL